MRAVGVWEALFVTVVGGLLVKWLSSEENREMAKARVREKGEVEEARL